MKLYTVWNLEARQVCVYWLKIILDILCSEFWYFCTLFLPDQELLSGLEQFLPCSRNGRPHRNCWLLWQTPVWLWAGSQSWPLPPLDRRRWPCPRSCDRQEPPPGDTEHRLPPMSDLRMFNENHLYFFQIIATPEIQGSLIGIHFYHKGLLLRNEYVNSGDQAPSGFN